ncbi:unnamed protein product [Caenorhabditis auriculariae]|uniref:Transmembrane protein 256 homolog n=1 Tax=Caenorhabditis auriculariae TaxID=2777116 RepID=A0A8S1H3H4_9PELO|nr:unnamed protein product [Caenorhabditis auriculariae]
MASAIWDTVLSISEYIPLISAPPKNRHIHHHHTASAPSLLTSAPDMRLFAISLGAYGSHKLRDNLSISERRRLAFETGNRYHLIHSLGLVAACRSTYPKVTAAIFLGGIILFCGPCYHYAITGREESRQVTPLGGILLILGWLSLCL